MSDLCPHCGSPLEFEWVYDGVATKCTRCAYKTRPLYQHSETIFVDWL